MQAPRISIDDFVRGGYGTLHNYRDLVVLTDRLEQLRPLASPARLDGTAVFVCMDGCIDCRVNECAYHLEKNSLLIIFSGDLIQIDSISGMEGYAAMMSDQFLDELDIPFSQRAAFFTNMRANTMLSVSDEIIDQLRPFYNLSVRILAGEASEKEDIIKGLVLAFCYRIIALMKSLRPPQATPTMTRNQEIFRNFISLVSKYHCKEHSVAFYAAELGLTPKYLSYAVKAFSHRGALDWINEHIMIEARSMLRNSDRSIKEIAYILNFPTQSAFGKFFHQKQGVGPKEYRYEA